MSINAFHQRRSRYQAAALLAFAIFTICGCARPTPVCPASGQLRLNGRPLEGAYVVFHALGNPQKELSPDTARTLPDGSFIARVRGPGEYAVTVFWPQVTQENGDIVEGEDQFKGKYRKVDRPVQKVVIQKGDNALPPINLTYP